MTHSPSNMKRTPRQSLISDDFFRDPVEAEALKRETWPHSVSTYIIGMMAAVGLNNLLIFPMKVYTYRGLAFIIPTLTFYTIFGLPILYLEMFLGQYSGGTNIDLFGKMVPLFQGLGWFMTFTSLCICLPYGALFGKLAGEIYYCMKYDCGITVAVAARNNSTGQGPSPILGSDVSLQEINFGQRDFPWVAVLVILIMFVCSTLLLSVRIRYAAYIFYVLTVVAVLSFFAVFFRVIFLPNAKEGLRKLLNTDMNYLARFTTWAEAGAFVIQSINVGIGFNHLLGSRTPFHGNLMKPALGILLTDCWVSFLGAIIFSALNGNFQQHLNGSSELKEFIGAKLLDSNPQQIIPIVLSSTVMHNFFIICMVSCMTIAIYTTLIAFTYPIVEYVCTHTSNSILKRRPITSIVVCAPILLGSLILLIPKLQMFAYILFSMEHCLLWATLLEVLLVGWIYGKPLFREKIAHAQTVENMPGSIIYIFIQFIVPLVILGCVGLALGSFNKTPQGINTAQLILKVIIFVGSFIGLLIVPAIWTLKKTGCGLKKAIEPQGLWKPLSKANLTVALLEVLDKKSETKL